MDEAPRVYKPGTEIVGTVYRVMKLIGAGGMGTVYDVEDTTVGKRYVLKTLHPDLVGRTDLAKRMVSEARSLARLSHSNIVEVVTAGVTKDELKLPFYVMEKLNGENLRSVLHKRGRLELPFALHIGIDLLDALDCAHDQNILHRDVKPDNIFLHRGANNVTVTKLLDFGSSRDTTSTSPRTTAGGFVGTPRYAGPEQLQGQPVTVRTDLYSAALVIYEMLAGRGPFDDLKDLRAIAQAHVDRQPPLLADVGVTVPQALEKLLRSALSKDPDKRPKDAFTFAAQLRNFKRQEDRPPTGAPDSRPTQVALIRGLDKSQPPSPLPEPIVASTPAGSAGAPPAPIALALTVTAETLASTPAAKSPDTRPGMASPTPPGTLVSANEGDALPVARGVDRSAETRTAVIALPPQLGPAGTEPVEGSVSEPPWATSPGAGADPRDTIRESKPAGQQYAEAGDGAAAQQLLVALPGNEGTPARTDGASVSNVAQGPRVERRRSVALVVVAVTAFAVVATGTLALALRWHGRAEAEVPAAAPEFPAPVVPPPTLATPLFDEIPTASAAPSTAPPAPAQAPPSASAAAPATTTAPPPGPAAVVPVDDPRPRPVRPARTAPAVTASAPAKRHLPGSGL